MTDVKEFVVEYIQREYTIPDDVDIMTLDYVDSGYVDSLAMIQFITTIEDEFDVAFSDEELQDLDIQIVGKLIAMIESKRGV